MVFFFAAKIDFGSKIGGYLMRHFYFRLIIGIIWLAAAAVSAVSLNIPVAVLNVMLGIKFIWSAFSVRKKRKDMDNDQ